MTDKQKEAIEEFEKLIKLRKNKAGEIKFDTCIVSTAQLEIVVNLIQTQQAEIEKKDKIIDLMSEELTTPLHSKEWVKEYYERKVENGR